MNFLTKVAALFVIATSSTASKLNQKTTRGTVEHQSGGAIDEEMSIDVVNKIQLEDQAFWQRSLSMSVFHEGDSSYMVYNNNNYNLC
eukprot:CAMPEP_0172414744 /NCGR_PEP_ID=MMETSP1064-20121228/1377_1 /TAXON_ID=202472 /ORGANISM="Aulacoseira subarctica , Strain CCAP 1002/5" /LENGTH=86 /DNA_ID=CAMNT_0013151551 /DNA_START=61 /DNA_END=321 /DNA_ORIENTATION=-